MVQSSQIMPNTVGSDILVQILGCLDTIKEPIYYLEHEDEFFLDWPGHSE